MLDRSLMDVENSAARRMGDFHREVVMAERLDPVFMAIRKDVEHYVSSLTVFPPAGNGWVNLAEIAE